MAERIKLSPEQMAKLLALASAKTGLKPQEIVALLRGGDIQKLVERFGGGREAAELFASGRLEELLAEPAVRDMISGLLK